MVKIINTFIFGFDMRFLLKKIIFTVSLCTFALGSAQAEDFSVQDSTMQFHQWRPVLTVSLGVTIPNQMGKDAYFGPEGDPTLNEFYSYAPNRFSQTRGLINLFAGGEFDYRPNLGAQLGFEYDKTSNYAVDGTYKQGLITEAPEDVQQWNYAYSITTQQFLASAKLLSTFNQVIHPYLSFAAGVSRNKSYNYSEDASLSDAYYTTRHFDNKTVTSFSYAVGFGTDFDLTKKTRLGVGYRFADLGKAELGRSKIYSTDVPSPLPIQGSLSQTHLYTNDFLAQFTYIF